MCILDESPTTEIELTSRIRILEDASQFLDHVTPWIVGNPSLTSITEGLPVMRS